ncbi:hypothetical protein IKW75_03080 [Candidatus Saccharibacteria bacterium]|nr:hypothetical protein [Candidatus Saccharibacteria bacterium]
MDDWVGLDAKKREQIYRLMLVGTISRKDFDKAILSVPGPDVEVAFGEVSKSNYKLRILAYFAGVGFNNFAQATVNSLKLFLAKYPTPMSFKSAKQDFLAAVKRSNAKEKYLEYEKETTEFMEIVYGERLKAEEFFERLEKDAEEWRLDREAEKLKQEFLVGAEIEGDIWPQRGTDYKLTPEVLDKGGLGPRFLLEVGGVRIALSKVFRADIHEAAIAYVKFDTGVKVRGYYRGNSQGMWRYLADYVGADGAIAWYGVGFNEESLTLPLKIQKALNMAAEHGIHELKNANMAFFLGATAHRFSSKDKYKRMVAAGEMTGAYYEDVSRKPLYDFGTLSPTKRPPQSIDVSGELAPNFREEIDHYAVPTDMYGKVTFRQFPSFDDSLRYTICEVGEGDERKVWIGGIEVNAPISSTGLKTQWVSTGDICTPLLEYRTMTGGYGTDIGRRDGYYSMWERYLKFIPVIRRYLFG